MNTYRAISVPTSVTIEVCAGVLKALNLMHVVQHRKDGYFIIAIVNENELSEFHNDLV